MSTLGKNLLGSLTGQVEKARITIFDRRGYKVNVREVKGKRMGENGEEAFSTFSLFTGDGITEELGAEGILAENLDAKKAELQDKLFNEHTTRKTYIVGFNPSSLNIHAIGGGRFSKNNYAQGGNTTSDFAAMNPRLQLDFKLYFDAHVNREWIETRAFSVQPEVEAFIAALRDEGTREIEFAWGKMVYTGVVNMVDATYTMFSTYGCPIRAEMNVTMLCVDEGLAHGDESTWAEHYEEAFAEDIDLRSRGQKVSTAVRGLLNLS